MTKFQTTFCKEKKLNTLYNIFHFRIDELIKNFNWMSVIELCIIASIIAAVYMKFIKNSPSRKLFNGIVSIIIMYIFSRILVSMDINLLGRFVEGISLILLFSLVVIFQPELRRFLGYLGQPGFIHKTLFAPPREERNINFTSELTDAIKYLSKSKIGALMVIQDSESMSAYSEIGTKIFGDISSELILTIFHPNTALHDGAMLMTTNKIIAAGVLLPLTEDPELSWQYGTRHRAAIGITEMTDSTCIVVSEETGFVSIAKGGKLKKIDTIEILSEELDKLIETPETNPKKRFSFTNFVVKNEKDTSDK